MDRADLIETICQLAEACEDEEPAAGTILYTLASAMLLKMELRLVGLTAPLMRSTRIAVDQATEGSYNE